MHDVQFFNDTVAVGFDNDGVIDSLQFLVEAKNGYTNTWMDIEVHGFNIRNRAYFDFIQETVNEWLNNLENSRKYDGEAV